MQYGRGHQDRLHRRERVADALTGTAAKGKVGETGKAAGGVVGPTFWAERFGLVEPASVAWHTPCRHDHDAFGRHEMSGYLGRTRRLPAKPIGWRVESHRLCHDHLG